MGEVERTGDPEMSPEPDPRRVYRALSDFCRWAPAIGSLKPEDMRCPECGHSDLAHIGVDHCPVCELVYQATPEFRRQQMRIAGIPPQEIW